MKTKVAVAGLVGSGLLGLAAPVSAAITTWSFDAVGCTTNNTNYDNARTCTSPSQLTATGWSNTGQLPGSPTGSQLDSARIVMYGGGIGTTNKDGPGGPAGGGDSNEVDSDAPEHAVDNDQRKDSVLLTFTSAIQLTDVQIGYRSGDADMTVLAFTGGTCAGAVAGKTYTELLSCGWALVRHVADVPAKTSTLPNFTSINNTGPGAISSQQWLVSTYISDLANPSKTIGSIETSTVKDHIKLLAVKGDPNGKVPEPGTLALLGAAAFGLWRFRRRA